MSEAIATPGPGSVAAPGSPSAEPAPAPAPASVESAAPAAPVEPAAPAAPPATPSFASTIPGLSPDIANNPALEGVKDLGDLASQFVNLQGLIGKKAVGVPGDASQPHEWDAFYNQLGRPEEASGYSFVKDLDEATLAGAQPFLDPMLKTFHEAGLTDAQARKVAEAYVGSAADTVESHQARAAEALEQSQAALRSQWGNAYDAKIEYAREAAESIFGDRMDDFNQVQLIDGSYLGDNPMMMQLLAALGESGGEGSIHPGGKRATLTPEEATAELQAMMADEQFVAAYKNRDHPQHKAVLDRRLQLRRMMNPGASSTDLYAPKL